MADSPPASAVVAAINQITAAAPALSAHRVNYGAGDFLLTEGRANRNLFVLLSGQLELLKAEKEGTPPTRVSLHQAGDLVGVNSFVTHRPSFSSARALTPLEAFRLDEATLAALPETHPELHALVQRLIVANLGDRYRAAVDLQLRLQRANRDLADTRHRLVHQERMAMLGQLVAGIAHELNNPAAALQRQRDFLVTALSRCFTLSPPVADWDEFWQAGLAAPPTPGSAQQRESLATLHQRHPQVTRALLRRLASLPPVLRDRLQPRPGPTPLAVEDEVRLTGFECAQWLHAQGLAAAQVAHLVASLKSYVRPDSAGPSRVNLAESITGVLTMLGHELKPHQLETELDPSLHVHAPPGDLWQIWTNLIQNACDALPPSGRLEITTRAKDHHQVEVAVIDHGPGVPAALRERIFDLNFTTKTGDEHFGLGLGLGITQSLVTQHGGRIWLSDTPGGGATFTVSLPLSQ